MSVTPNQSIFKILTLEEWNQIQSSGVFEGSPVDLADGFVHFSLKDQVEETARRHFSGQQELCVLEVNSDSLQEKLKFEPSRGGDLFPHLYGQLNLTEVISTKLVQKNSNGEFDFQW